MTALAVLAAIAFGAAAAEAAALKPADPQPGTLSRGLAVDYYFNKMRHLDELVEHMRAEAPARGEPLPNLDYVRGADKPVLTSTNARFVGAEITGYVNFPEAGTYNLFVVSNDGVRLWIDGTMIYEDPDVHADRQSDPIPITIAEPGWHDIRLLYFQRKNTTALVLGWARPGRELEVIPPEFFAHAPR